jgi:hypothetical protein
LLYFGGFYGLIPSMVALLFYLTSVRLAALLFMFLTLLLIVGFFAAEFWIETFAV